MLRWFVNLNWRLAWMITPNSYMECGVRPFYTKCLHVLLAQPKMKRVADIGAGREWLFSQAFKDSLGIHLTGVDIDADELAHNKIVDRAIVSDVTEEIPIEAETLDLITCFSGVEHFKDNAAFLANAYKALRPGGMMIMQFPNSLAPFAIMNRMMPQWLAKALLYRLLPGSETKCGFKAFYDRTRYSPFKRMAKKQGFEVAYYYPAYFSSAYFAFFLPAYLISLLFDLLRFILAIKNLASYNLFVLKKPGGDDPAIIWS